MPTASQRIVTTLWAKMLTVGGHAPHAGHVGDRPDGPVHGPLVGRLAHARAPVAGAHRGAQAPDPCRVAGDSSGAKTITLPFSYAVR